VRAHSYSLGQLLVRWAKRNATTLVVAAAALVLVVGGAVFSVRRIVRERDRANREAEAARRVSDFLTSMFRSNNPERARGATITAREVLDRGARQIEGELSGEPEMKARLMFVMGEVYASLGLHQQAQPLFERALEEQRKDPDAALDALRTRAGLGQAQHLAGHYDQAAATLAEVLQAQTKLLGPDDAETLKTAGEWAANENDRGHFQVARDGLRRVYEARTRTLGPENLDTLRVMNQLANVLARLGELPEAEKLQQSALATARKKLGETHPVTFAILGALAGTYGHEHKFTQAAELANESLAVARRVLGPDHPETLSSWTLYAQMVALSGKRAEAEAPARECFERHRAVLGEDHPETLDAEYTLALTMRRPGGNLAECERLHRDVLARRMRTLGPETPDVLASYSALAYTLADEERYADSAAAMESLLDLQKKLLGPRNGAVAITAHDLASLSMSLNQRDRALQLLTEAVDIGLPPKAAVNLTADPDWKPLLDDPRFQAIVATAKAKATAQK
jgi:non-specific serine/threonine protein kinase/serine/threonine-protein kinase